MPSEAFQTAFAAFGHLKTPSFPRRRESESKKPKPNGLDSRLRGNWDLDYSVSRRMGNGGNCVKNAV
ncbi:hypothetical protein, partial [Neisseria meningitidis]|uniref:hypothetical protein n=1 Tax=Neisseria meningitidis TaxID=487 RepID=UPI000AD87274